MSADDETVEEVAVEEEEIEELTLEDLRPKLYRLIYNQPTVLLFIIETLFELLGSRGVMRPDEAEEVIREGLKRWRDANAPVQ